MGIDHLSPEAKADILMKFEGLMINLSEEARQEFRVDLQMAQDVIRRIVAGEEVTEEDREQIGRYQDAISQGVDELENPWECAIQKFKVILTMAKLKFEGGAFDDAEQDIYDTLVEAKAFRDMHIRDEGEGSAVSDLENIKKIIEDINKLDKALLEILD